MRRFAPLLVFLLGCDFAGTFAGGDGDDDGNDNQTPDLDPIYQTISGDVVDFETGAAVDIDSIEVLGLEDTVVAIDGSSFTISNVLSFSVVHLAVSAAGHEQTINSGIEVEDADLSVTQTVVASTFVDSSATAFGLDPQQITSMVLVQARDDGDAPMAGIPDSVFPEPDGASGPYFLDSALAADVGRQATSSSGWLAFFDVATGIVQLDDSAGSGYVVMAPGSPVLDGAVTLVTATIVEGELDLPTNVSFGDDIRPLFGQLGCPQCHRRDEVGDDLGNLAFDRPGQIHRELTEELSPSAGTPRVNLDDFATSLVLTKPLLEDPPDGHPNSTFASTIDPNYLLLRVWIEEGALDN